MGIGKELESALRELTAAGRVEVRENGEWLAALDGMQYEIRCGSSAILLHMWSSQQTLVRRVLRLAEQSRGSVVVEVARFDGRPARLEFVAAAASVRPFPGRNFRFSDQRSGSAAFSFRLVHARSNARGRRRPCRSCRRSQ